MKRLQNILIPGLIIVLSAVFFYKGFAGFAIEGGDGGYWIYHQFSNIIKDTVSRFDDTLWIGNPSGTVIISVLTGLLKIIPVEIASIIHYFTIVILSLTFTYLFLRKQNLSKIASLFGSVAYAFTPSFITLIFSGHIFVLDMMFITPLLFYLIYMIFEDVKFNWFRNIVLTLAAGSAWGIMMTDDIQRGLYISIAVALYILFLIFNKNQIKWKNLLKDIFTKSVFLDFVKALAIAVVLFLAFLNGLNPWLNSLKGREALQNNNANPTLSKSSQEKWDFATSWSLHPFEMIDNFAFGFHGAISGDSEMPYWGEKPYSGNSEVMGFFVLLFGILGFFSYFKKIPFVVFCSIIFALYLLLSFGSYWPGKPFFGLFYLLPLISNFRAPSKFISVAAFFIVILAAYGIESLIKKDTDDISKHNSLLTKIILAAAGLEIIVLFFIIVASPNITSALGEKIKNLGAGTILYNNLLYSITRMFIFTILTLIILFLQQKNKFSASVPEKIKKYIPIVWIVLCVFDLWSIDWYYMNKVYFKISEKYQPDSVIQTILKDKDVFRVGTSLMIPDQKGQAQSYPVTGLKGYYLTYMFPVFGIQPMDITASSGLDIEYNNFFIGNLRSSITGQISNLDGLIDVNLRLMRMANVKYFVFDGLIKNTNILLTNVSKGYDNKDHAIYYLPDSLPRIAFYDNYLSVSDNNQALNTISDPNFNIQTETVLNNAPLKTKNSTNKVQVLKILEYKPYKITAELNGLNNGAVLMTTKYDKDWSAYLDNHKIPVYRANYLEVGAVIDQPGEIIEFRYEPDSKPFWISFTTIMLSLVLSIIYGIKERLLSRK